MKRFWMIPAVVSFIGFCSVGLAGPDLSTPKTAALAFAKAIEAGNADDAKAVAAADAQNQELAAILADVSGHVKQLREAAKAKFGEDEGKKVTGQMSTGEMSKQLDAADVKQDGDTATITGKEGSQSALKLTKSEGQWHVDMAGGQQGSQLTQQIPFIKALGGIMGDLATEITDGKYKNADDAQVAMQTKLMTAMATMKRPTTGPATKPAKP